MNIINRNDNKCAPGKQNITSIGKNVFICMNSIILMGANIEDNVIIGTGSVVRGRIEKTMCMQVIQKLKDAL